MKQQEMPLLVRVQKMKASKSEGMIMKKERLSLWEMRSLMRKNL